LILRGTAGARGASAGTGHVTEVASVSVRRRIRHPPPARRAPPSSPVIGAPTRPATCTRKASARMGGAAGHLRRGVRDPWCACRASWHRAVSCPSASVETPVIRAVDRRRCARCRHTAGRTAVNCRNRRNRPVWKVAAFYAAMPSTTVRQLIGQVPTLLEGTIVGRAGGEHVYDMGTAR